MVTSAADILAAASEALDARTTAMDTLSRYYNGQQGTAFLSPKAREAIGDRLRALPVNLVRVAVDVLAERLSVQGFTVGGPDAGDAGAWGLWTGSRMVTASAAGHLDSLLYGVAFVSVWTGPDRRTPSIRVESPRQCTVTLDPVTGEPVSAVKRWWQDRRGWAVVMEPDRITRLRTASETARESGFPVRGWETVETLPNRLGEVPITPLPNRPTTDTPLGQSEITDVMPLVDALSKLCQDLIVVSEAHSRPRRWVTGLEVVEEPVVGPDGQPVLDADGEPVTAPVNPFAESPERVWQIESPEARVGQLDATSLGSFVEGTGILLRAIAATSAVPPATLGLTSDAPASAEALRASEVSLVARARARQVVLGEAWARVMRHALIVRDGAERPAYRRVETSWADAETRSEIVAADRAAKLHALGVPLAAILADLGWSPRRVDEVLAQRRREAFDSAGIDLARVLRL